MCVKWSEEEILILRNNYSNKKKSELLLLLPTRTYQAIKLKAAILGLKKERNEYCESDCSSLLDDVPESYYWAGLIMADGHISQNNRLKIQLSEKDEETIYRFAQYVKCSNVLKVVTKNTNHSNYLKVSCQDKLYVKKFAEKFDIKHNKTYNPPNLKIDNIELLIAFFVGFIDGDGCIKNQTGRNDCIISIHIHSSWIETLSYFKKKIEELSKAKLTDPVIGGDGYARWSISNSTVIKLLKRTAVSLNLPLMRRKWNKIDLSKVGKQEKASLDLLKIKEMMDAGDSIKKISQILNRTETSTKALIKRRLNDIH